MIYLWATIIRQNTAMMKYTEAKEMEVLYRSTRNNSLKVKASEAILKGLSDDGGLFVPDQIPEIGRAHV